MYIVTASLLLFCICMVLYRWYTGHAKSFFIRHRGPVLPYISPAIPVGLRADGLAKNRDFENGIVSRFLPQYFQLIHWRTEKSFADIYPVSQHYPDFQFEYQHQGIVRSFAVECKWQPAFERGAFEWTTKEERKHFNHYEQKYGIPVFIIFGIGETPFEPSEIFLVPLADLQSQDNTLTASFLSSYEKTDKHFFFHATSMQLI